MTSEEIRAARDTLIKIREGALLAEEAESVVLLSHVIMLLAETMQEMQRCGGDE